MNCPNCGYANPDDASFCGECGASLARDIRCPSCGRQNLQSKSALEGERKQVTVLFADVKGSVELSQAVDPEDWHRIMDRFMQNLAEGVHRFEGTVNQYLGDGIMAAHGGFAQPTRKFATKNRTAPSCRLSTLSRETIVGSSPPLGLRNRCAPYPIE